MRLLPLPRRLAWRERPHHDDARVIEHPCELPEDECRLHFSLRDPDRIAIYSIKAEAHARMGHMKPLLDELRRRYPDRSVWQIETPLTADGQGFWPHVAEWLEQRGVTLLDANGVPIRKPTTAPGTGES